jgi:hypothetical protein
MSIALHHEILLLGQITKQHALVEQLATAEVVGGEMDAFEMGPPDRGGIPAARCQIGRVISHSTMGR